MNRGSCLGWLFIVAVFPFAASAEPLVRLEPSPDETLLKSKGIDPSTNGLRTYLQSLQPGEEQQQLIASLIEQLGSTESFAAREAAMGRLAALPVLPREALVQAAAGSDPEVRWRAQRILAAGGGESERLLHAAFRVIAKKPVVGLVRELLLAIPAFDQQYLKSAARQAVGATADKSDAALLRLALKDKNAAVRAAAVAGCLRALGKQAAADLAELLEDEDDGVRVEAARGLAAVGDRRSLGALAELLKCERPGVRFAAFAALRDAAGQDLGYNALGPAEERETAAEKWAAWAAGEGQTTKLNAIKPLGINDGYLETGATLEGGYQIAANGHFRDSLYVLVLQPAGMNFATANEIAARIGGHLACIEDAEEDAFVVRLNQSAGSNTPWIGLTDAEVEGQWKWASGERVAFTNWAPGEPNNLGDEDAVQMHAHGTWNDANINGQVVACLVEIPR